VFKFVTFGQRDIDKVMRYLPDKKFRLALHLLLLRGSRPKSAKATGQPSTMYSECSRFHPNRFTFGGVIPERANTIKTGRKVFPIFGWSLGSSRIITHWHHPIMIHQVYWRKGCHILSFSIQMPNTGTRRHVVWEVKPQCELQSLYHHISWSYYTNPFNYTIHVRHQQLAKDK